MNINGFFEIIEQIAALLALPMPIPAEKHLQREKIFALKYEQAGLAGDLQKDEQDQLARDFTLRQVPQNVAAYSIALRETCMPVRRKSMKEINRPTPGQCYGNWHPTQKLPPR